MSPYRPLKGKPSFLIDCPCCDGHGEISICANDGRCGCSHVHDKTYRCDACNGQGQVPRKDTHQPDWCPTCGLSTRCPLCNSGDAS